MKTFITITLAVTLFGFVDSLFAIPPPPPPSSLSVTIVDKLTTGINWSSQDFQGTYPVPAEQSVTLSSSRHSGHVVLEDSADEDQSVCIIEVTPDSAKLIQSTGGMSCECAGSTVTVFR